MPPQSAGLYARRVWFGRWNDSPMGSGPNLCWPGMTKRRSWFCALPYACALAAGVLAVAILGAGSSGAAELPGTTDAWLRAVMPDADGFAGPDGSPPAYIAYRDGEAIGYAFFSKDVSAATGYSARPLNVAIGLRRDGIIATAPGQDRDYVCRFFVPQAGIPEDPATGMAQCSLVPYWAERLGRTKLSGRQISARVGEFRCELKGDRVRIAGNAVCYLKGSIFVD